MKHTIIHARRLWAAIRLGRHARAILCLSIGLPLVMLSACGKASRAGDQGLEPAVVKMTPGKGPVTVVAVGDILLGNASTAQLNLRGYDWPFEQVKPLLADADLVIGNLAGPITAATNSPGEDKGYTYKVNPESAPALKRAGFHTFCAANNHMLDYGMESLLETLGVIRTNGMATFGSGASESEARRGVVYDFGTVRIGLLGYGEAGSETRSIAKGERGGYALLTVENLEQDIARMREAADVVVVSLHWGKNYKRASDSQQKMGQRAIDLGADLVYGHHSHIAEGIEVYKDKPIIYSLGNFVFGTSGRFKDKQGYGLVSRWIFEGKKLKWILSTPIGINNELVKFQPQRVSADEARKALEREFKRHNTEVRWQADTAYLGFDSEWQTASLPDLPWVEQAEAANQQAAVESLEPIP